MKVSLAIATIGRTAELERLLDSLCAQSHQNFEVLIADQNPMGFLTASLNRYEGKLRIRNFIIPPSVASFK